jgi:hypothetical protein
MEMAAADEGSDWSLVNFAKQVFGAKSAAPEVGFDFVEPAPAETEPAPTEDEAAPTAAEADQVIALESEAAAGGDEIARAEDPDQAVETEQIAATETAVTDVEDVPSLEATESETSTKERQSRTPSELADIILNAIRTDVGFPERGFVVTVYGASPWNAMLTIKPEAGSIKDARRWRERVQDIGARLRRDFDVIHEPLPPEEIPETPIEIAETPSEIPEVGVD